MQGLLSSPTHQKPVDVHQSEDKEQSIEEEVEGDIRDQLEAGVASGVEHLEGEPVETEPEPARAEGAGWVQHPAGIPREGRSPAPPPACRQPSPTPLAPAVPAFGICLGFPGLAPDRTSERPCGRAATEGRTQFLGAGKVWHQRLAGGRAFPGQRQVLTANHLNWSGKVFLALCIPSESLQTPAALLASN